jgi:HEAT repeat protein
MSQRSADYDERLRRLFEARRKGETAYLIDSLRTDPELAPSAAAWLADAGSVEAIPNLIHALEVANPFARSAGLRALQKLGPPASAKAKIVDLAQHDPDRFVRSRASTVLGYYGDRSLTPLLLALLRDPDWQVRTGAAVGLGKHGDLQALEPLRAELKKLRRTPWIWYLSRLGYKQSIQELEKRRARPQVF